MTQTVDRYDALRGTVSGPVLVPSDAGYDDARRVWNAGIATSPAVVVRCRGDEDVVAALRFARAEQLPVAVRGGAHNTSGSGTVEGGLVIDLSLLNGVDVDPDARTALVGGGALLRDLDAATQAHGLAVPAGEISHTGVGGLTLGGGMGWLSRRLGLAIDNLRSARVVLTDGRVVRAAADENPDLFWALRGGGGNFGVVTAFEFALHEIGPLVQVGLFFYTADRGRDALRLTRALRPALPPGMGFQVVGMPAPPAPFVPAEYQGASCWAVALVGFAGEEEFAAAADRVRDGLAPTFEMVAPMPYTALQQMFDEDTAWGQYAYEKSCYVSADFDDGVVETLARALEQRPAVLALIELYVLDGAYSDVDDDATAFGGGRTPRFAVIIPAMAADDAELALARDWIRSVHASLSPSALADGRYVNSLAADDGGRARAVYGPKYDRLAEIKATYDPDNVLRRNANIVPAHHG